MKKHNKAMHSYKWEEYLQCSTAERKIFVDTALESNTALSCFQEKPIVSTDITVDKKIIEKIIEDLLYWLMMMKKSQLKPPKKRS